MPKPMQHWTAEEAERWLRENAAEIIVALPERRMALVEERARFKELTLALRYGKEW